MDGAFSYHPRCDALKLTHLCFADDLLMFCKGDIHSILILKDAVTEFGEVSGLKPNLGKSRVYLANIGGQLRSDIINILPFKVGKLRVRNLGVPLIATRLYHKDCQAIIDKVKKRLQGWKNKLLSYAGRLQLVKSVLSSIHVFWSSLFILDVSLTNEIEKLIRSFLWSNGGSVRGKAKVKWSEVCLPIEQGGLGIKSLRMWNRALMTKHIWNILCKEDSLWVRWIGENKLKGRNIWDAPVGNDATGVGERFWD